MDSRDPQRAPMAWANEVGAGFTTGKPWLPIPADLSLKNVQRLEADEQFILHLYRELLHLRRSERIFLAGDQRSLKGREHVLVFQRYLDGKCFHVALNFSDVPQVIDLPGRGVVELG